MNMAMCYERLLVLFSFGTFLLVLNYESALELTKEYGECLETLKKELSLQTHLVFS